MQIGSYESIFSISARFSHKPAQVLRGSIGKSLKCFSVLLIIVNLTSICQSYWYLAIFSVLVNLTSVCQFLINIISLISICQYYQWPPNWYLSQCPLNVVQLNRRECSDIPNKWKFVPKKSFFALQVFFSTGVPIWRGDAGG